jgi:membrane protein insertase Oxa1/YidC/SpoIIIJ
VGGYYPQTRLESRHPRQNELKEEREKNKKKMMKTKRKRRRKRKANPIAKLTPPGV